MHTTFISWLLMYRMLHLKFYNIKLNTLLQAHIILQKLVDWTNSNNIVVNFGLINKTIK